MEEEGKGVVRYFEVSREIKIGNAGMGICGSDGEGLGRGTGASNASRSTVTVRRGTQHNGSDRIAVSNCIPQPLHNDSANSLRLHISISGHVKGVA